MPKEGLEPSHLAIHDFESCASTIPPLRLVKLKRAKENIPSANGPEHSRMGGGENRAVPHAHGTAFWSIV